MIDLDHRLDDLIFFQSTQLDRLRLSLDLHVPTPQWVSFGWFVIGIGGSQPFAFDIQPNGFGLFDVHGNLWEWTADWYGCSFPPTSTDPHCNSTGSGRVFRGGGWDYGPNYLQASSRYSYGPASRNGSFGFRLVLLP